MRFASTRSPDSEVSFREAVFRGLAPDGGLYQPMGAADLRGSFLSLDASSSMGDIARVVMRAILRPELSEESIERIAERAFPFAPRLARLDEDISILELFHGPTCAFKDFGASFLAALMQEYLARDGRRAVILTATSGDTGSAVARAFHGRANIEVVILYPSGRVSPLQEKQLTTLGGNVSAVEVAGSFDDCQRMVKDVFLDPALSERLRLTSANSINLGRLLPQVFYYVYGFLRLRADWKGDIVFCVPSGNFGNLTAGVLAWRWGLPVDDFISATNANRVVPDYLETGVFTPRPSLHTLSNAMDVGNPSNFERLLAVFDGDLGSIRTMVKGVSVSDEETREAMARAHRERGVFLDPHTALGVRAAEKYLRAGRRNACRVVCLGTAHPGKFLEVVEEATGERPPLPETLAAVLKLEPSSVPIGRDTADLKTFLLGRFA